MSERLSEEQLDVLQTTVAIYRESGATADDVAIEIGVDALESMLTELREHRAREKAPSCELCGYPIDEHGCSRPC